MLAGLRASSLRRTRLQTALDLDGWGEPRRHLLVRFERLVLLYPTAFAIHRPTRRATRVGYGHVDVAEAGRSLKGSARAWEATTLTEPPTRGPRRSTYLSANANVAFNVSSRTS